MGITEGSTGIAQANACIKRKFIIFFLPKSQRFDTYVGHIRINLHNALSLIQWHLSIRYKLLVLLKLKDFLPRKYVRIQCNANEEDTKVPSNFFHRGVFAFLF